MAYRRLVGLVCGGICGAVLGCFYVLVLRGGLESWNDPGTLSGGRVGENSLTFTQTLTLWFGIFGGLTGSFLGLLIGVITTRRRRD